MDGYGKCSLYGLYMKDSPTPLVNIMAKSARRITCDMVQEASCTDHIISGFLTCGDRPTKYCPPLARLAKPARSLLRVHTPLMVYQERVIIPASFRSEVKDILHSSHGGVSSMMDIAREGGWLPDLQSEKDTIREILKNLSNCFFKLLKI